MKKVTKCTVRKPLGNIRNSKLYCHSKLYQFGINTNLVIHEVNKEMNDFQMDSKRNYEMGVS